MSYQKDGLEFLKYLSVIIKKLDHSARKVYYSIKMFFRVKNIQSLHEATQRKTQLFPISAAIFFGIGRLRALLRGFGDGSRSFRLRHLSIFFAMGIVYSVLLASYHHHDGCIIRSDCPYCKFAIDFASVDAIAAPPVIIPDYTYLPLVQKDIVCFCGICPASTTSRAPPALRSS